MNAWTPGGWEVIGFSACSCLILTIYGIVFHRLNQKIRVKGYPPPFTWLSLGAAFIAVIAGAAFGVYTLYPRFWFHGTAEHLEPRLVWLNIAAFAGSGFLGSFPFGIATMAVCLLLPQRARRAGKRQTRFPWKILSGIFQVCLFALLPASYFIWARGGWSAWLRVTFRLMVLLLGAYRWTAFMARRLAAPGVDEILEADHRAPVFYLREFAQEDRPFMTLSYDECEKLGVPMLNAQSFRHPATFEQCFDLYIRQKIGPFVALGNPYDYAPPGGAAREYLGDDQWIHAFRDLARRSSLVVMHTGGSANLQRELTMLGEMKLTKKLFIFSMPKPKRRFRLFESRLIAQARKKWDHFADLFTKAGLRPCEYPGLGAVVTFQDNVATIVVQGCTTPEEYITAVEQQLRRLNKPVSISAARQAS